MITLLHSIPFSIQRSPLALQNNEDKGGHLLCCVIAGAITKSRTARRFVDRTERSKATKPATVSPPCKSRPSWAACPTRPTSARCLTRPSWAASLTRQRYGHGAHNYLRRLSERAPKTLCSSRQSRSRLEKRVFITVMKTLLEVSQCCETAPSPIDEGSSIAKKEVS